MIACTEVLAKLTHSSSVPTRTFFSLARMILGRGEGTWADNVSVELPQTKREQQIWKSCRVETEKEVKAAEVLIREIMEHNGLTKADLWPQQAQPKKAKNAKKSKEDLELGRRLENLGLDDIHSPGAPHHPDELPWYCRGEDVVKLPPTESFEKLLSQLS